MKCIVCPAPGSFAMTERPDPEPAEGEILVMIRRIGVCGTDMHAYRGNQPFFEYPRVLGHELSGFREDTGDPVAIIPYRHCGWCVPCRAGRTNCCQRLSVLGVHEDGGMCERVAVPASLTITAPDLGLDALATVECLAIGAHGVRRAAISGEAPWALVIGAGPIGVGAIQFARIAGARVIAMDVAPGRLAFCRDVLNVTAVVDARENPLEQIRALTGGEMPSYVFEATGNLASMQTAFDYPGHGGTLVFLSIVKGSVSFDDPRFHSRELSVLSSRNATRADFEHVITCIQAGQIEIDRFITHRAALDTVPDRFDSWLRPESGVMKAMIEC
jgi:threonine dehydrogenase-like Zn-dependent dehydrogenase